MNDPLYDSHYDDELEPDHELVQGTADGQLELWPDEPPQDRLIMWENGGWIPF